MTVGHSVSVIIPALDPDEGLLRYVERLTSAGYIHIIVVDDGSAAEKRHIFSSLQEEHGCIVLRHAVNMGKGRALKDAFNYHLTCLADECAGVITADSDGQHSVEDVINLELAMQNHPNSLILGARDFGDPCVPFKSRNGNRITRTVMKLLYGGNIRDTQTGLRAISNALIPAYLTLCGERFEYETGMLIETLRKKIPVENVAIQTIYIDNNSGTHFRPFADSWAIYKLIFSTFFSFSLSSVSSALIDLGIFRLLLFAFAKMGLEARVLAATVAARICSSLYNYTINKNIVFSSSRGSKASFVKYYALCAVQMLCSAAGVLLFCKWLALPELPVKLVVDCVLFLISFQIQRAYIFPSAGKEDGE